MKQLLVGTFLMFSFISFAQKDSSTTSVLDKTEQLIDKYGAKLASSFMTVIESSKPLVKETFEVVIWLQVAKGIGHILPLVFFIIFIVIFFSEYNKLDTILKSDKVPNYLDKKYGPFDPSNINTKMIITLMFSLITFALTIFTLYDGILYLLAPKWYAIKEIIGAFK